MKQLFKSIIAIAAIAAMSFTASARTSYRGFVSFDPALAISYSSVSPSDLSISSDAKATMFAGEVSTTHGVQINRHVFVGAGVGIQFSCNRSDYYSTDIQIMMDGDEYTFNVPIYVAARYDLDIARKVTPFVSCKLGYSLGIPVNGVYNIIGSSGDSLSDNGLYFQPTIGIRFRVGHHFGINLGLTLYPSYYKTTDYSELIYNNDVLTDIQATYHRYNFGLNIGFDF